jgi:hypothetical protein
VRVSLSLIINGVCCLKSCKKGEGDDTRNGFV